MAFNLARSDDYPDPAPLGLASSADYAIGRQQTNEMGGLGKKSALLGECTERLRTLVQQSGGTKQVATRSGVALSTLGSYLAGGEMKLSTAMQICAACSVSLSWLVGDDPGESVRSDTRDAFVRIRRVSTRAVDPPDGGYMMFSAAWLRAELDCAPGTLLALQVHGTAMEPTLRHGDLLLIDTATPQFSSLELHAIEVDGELLVRRLERGLDGGILVHTERERFAAQIIPPHARDTLKLVGRVVWKGSRNPL